MTFTVITDLSSIIYTTLGQIVLQSDIIFRFRSCSVTEIGSVTTILTTCIHETLQTSTKYAIYIQGIQKGMVQFQKLTRNVFITFHGHNIHRQQR
jgi:hypothetical protein